jgi:hypothetical protein
MDIMTMAHVSHQVITKGKCSIMGWSVGLHWFHPLNAILLLIVCTHIGVIEDMMISY